MSGHDDAAGGAVSLLAAFTARSDRREDLRVALRALEAASRGDPGCLEYRVFQDEDAPDRFVLIEHWTDAAALEEHNRRPHVTGFLATCGELLEAPFGVTRLRPVS